MIHRYEIGADLTTEIPGNVDPIFFGWQPERNAFSIWAIVPDTGESKTTRLARVVATGHRFPPATMQHIGSVIMPDGFHVFHAFVEV